MLVAGDRPSPVGRGILKPAVSDIAELAHAAEAGESDPWLVLSSYLEPFFEFTGSRERISLRGGTIGRAMISSTRSMRAQRKAPVYRVLFG